MMRLFRYFLLLSIVNNLKIPIGCLLWSGGSTEGILRRKPYKHSPLITATLHLLWSAEEIPTGRRIPQPESRDPPTSPGTPERLVTIASISSSLTLTLMSPEISQ